MSGPSPSLSIVITPFSCATATLLPLHTAGNKGWQLVPSEEEEERAALAAMAAAAAEVVTAAAEHNGGGGASDGGSAAGHHRHHGMSPDGSEPSSGAQSPKRHMPHFLRSSTFQADLPSPIDAGSRSPGDESRSPNGSSSAPSPLPSSSHPHEPTEQHLRARPGSSHPPLRRPKPLLHPLDVVASMGPYDPVHAQHFGGGGHDPRVSSAGGCAAAASVPRLRKVTGKAADAGVGLKSLAFQLGFLSMLATSQPLWQLPDFLTMRRSQEAKVLAVVQELQNYVAGQVVAVGERLQAAHAKVLDALRDRTPAELRDARFALPPKDNWKNKSLVCVKEAARKLQVRRQPMPTTNYF